MNQIRRLMIIPLCLTGAVACFAQMAEFSVSGGQSLLRNNVLTSIALDGGPGVSPVDVSLKDGFRLGFRITLNTYRFFGHEVGYAYNRSQLSLAGQDFGMAIHQGSYNFLAYALPEGSSVRPFLTGGGHFSNYVPPGQSAAQGGGVTKFGINYGGGVKARVGRMFMVRFDLREYRTPKPDFFAGPEPQGWLRQIEASAGFALTL